MAKRPVAEGGGEGTSSAEQPTRAITSEVARRTAGDHQLTRDITGEVGERREVTGEVSGSFILADGGIVDPTRVTRAETPDTRSGPTRIDKLRSPTGGSATGSASLDDGDSDDESQTRLKPGTRIGHYEIIRELGAGGMARVYLARDVKLGRRVAVKLIATPSRALSKRFVAEARATALCNHENIVVIHDVGVHEGTPFMVLEYLDGQTLSKVIRGQKLSAPRAVELMVPVLRALGRAHASGIVHRDLKPDNIFVTSTGQVKVLDFGIAKVLGEARRKRPTDNPVVAPGGTESTIAGIVVGTPAFMSPEQFGAEAIDHRADIWAVGIILYRMVTGRHPVADPSDIRLLQAHASRLDEPLPKVRSINRSVPPELADAIDRCLAKDKHKRWSSAEDLLEVLEPLLPGRLHRKLADDDSPYPGLRTFQEDDANRFFGRSHEVAGALARLREHPVLAVVGPSGVGKSSFIRAGVVPALKAGESWDVIVVRPGRDPVGVLAGIVARSGTDALMGDIRQRLLDEPGLLGAVIRARARGRQERVLLFIDQFEELYTLGADENERAAFIACLSGVADDARSRLRLVVSMRTDLLDRLTEHGEFASALMRGLTLLATPGEEALREALELPLGLAGYQFESPEIIDDMLDGLGSGTGVLPLLQFVADSLWTARDKDSKMLTRAAYEALGGVAGALATHADHVLSALPDRSQRFVRGAFERLVTPDRTRAIIDLDDIVALAESEKEGQRLVDYLVSERLLMVQRGEGGGKPTVEVVHESLITSWPTLRRWLDEDEEAAAFVAQLHAAARQWDERGRPEGLLWTGEPAREAQRWLDRGDRSLATREREFLEAVARLATRAQRRRRTFALAAFAVVGSVAVAAIVAVFLIMNAERTANEQAIAAEREADRARQAEAIAREAENQAQEARRKVEEQLRLVQQKEDEKQEAEAKATHATEQVVLSQGELKLANIKLQKALAAAEQAAQKERDAAASEKKASQRLEKLLAAEKERVRQLEQQKKKITTELR